MGRGVDLGDVTFGLNADTAGLDRALGKLRLFSQEVNKAARSSEEGSATMAAALARQERLLASSYQKVVDLNRAIKASGAPSSQLADTTVAYRSLTTALTKGEVTSIQYSRAQSQITARLNESRRALADWNAEKAREAAIDKARTQAYAEDARRTQAMGRVQSTASAVDSSRTQRMGRVQSAAIGVDEMRTRRLALAQMQAQAEDALRSQGKWHETLHNLGRAVVLIEGPLSGLGARMTVLSALFESSAMKMALTVAGVAALTAGVAYAGVAAVKATMQFQQWEASMVAASGAQSLVQQDMKYIIEQSNKFGQAIESTIPSWTNFATAARMAGLTIIEQKKVFESFMTAGSALHWGVDETRRAFLALEQILSKGKPQMQEVRLQLGQVLPGAFALAARGMQMTTKELGKAMEQGKIEAKEFVLGISAATEAAYRAASVTGRTSITADIRRFHNQTTLLARSFDDAVKASLLFQTGLQGITSLMSGMQVNMKNLVNGVLAVGFALPFVFGPSVLAGALAVGHAIKTATVAMWGFSAATAANPIGGLIMLMLRLGVALGVGTVAFKMLSAAEDSVTAGAAEYANALQKDIDTLEDVGEIDANTKKRMLDNHNKQIKAVDDEIARQRTLIDTLKKKDEAAANAAKATGFGNQGSSMLRTKPKTADNAELEEARKKQLTLLAQKQQMEREFRRVEGLKVTPSITAGEDEVSKAQKRAQDFLNGIQTQADHVNDSGNKYLQILAQAEKFAMKEAKNMGGFGSDEMVAFLNNAERLARPIKDFQELTFNAKRLGEQFEEEERQTNAAHAALESMGRTFREGNENLEHEISLIGMSNQQKEIAIALWTREQQVRTATTAANNIADKNRREQALADIEAFKKLTDEYIDGIARRRLATLNWETGFKDAFNAYADAAKNAAGQAANFVTNSLQGMEDALTKFITTGKLSFSDLANSMINDLARIIAKRAMLDMFGDDPVKSLGGFASSAIGFIMNGGRTTSTAAVAHGGGIVGFDGLGSRAVSSNVFNGAAKFHGGGLAGNEVPAILEKGEGVFTPGQMKALGNGGTQNIRVEVVNPPGRPAVVDKTTTRLDPEGMVLSIIMRDARDRGPISQTLEATYGLRR